MSGTFPGAGLLTRVRAGRIGGVILFSENFAAGKAVAKRAIDRLQRAAYAAGTWPLLIMTDQEGGEVRRILDSPPRRSPREMFTTQMARDEGFAAGRALAKIGVNVDLAPVADIERLSNSFLGDRSFGSSPHMVASRACAFARGLTEAGVDYTLKHFPGLGTALASTDNGPVRIDSSAMTLHTDYAAYRRCGADGRALVMISSASYPTLTHEDAPAPALDSREIYRSELPRAGIHAVTISDDLQARALVDVERPAGRALIAGIDLLLYAQTERAASEAYWKLYRELINGQLSRARVRQAAVAITRLKSDLASTYAH